MIRISTLIGFLKSHNYIFFVFAGAKDLFFLKVIDQFSKTSVFILGVIEIFMANTKVCTIFSFIIRDKTTIEK